MHESLFWFPPSSKPAELVLDKGKKAVVPGVSDITQHRKIGGVGTDVEDVVGGGRLEMEAGDDLKLNHGAEFLLEHAHCVVVRLQIAIAVLNQVEVLMEAVRCRTQENTKSKSRFKGDMWLGAICSTLN